MEKPLEEAWVGLQVGWGRASANHQSGANGASQVTETQILHPPVGLGLMQHAGHRKGSTKE